MCDIIDFDVFFCIFFHLRINVCVGIDRFFSTSDSPNESIAFSRVFLCVNDICSSLWVCLFLAKVYYFCLWQMSVWVMCARIICRNNIECVGSTKILVWRHRHRRRRSSSLHYLKNNIEMFFLMSKNTCTNFSWIRLFWCVQILGLYSMNVC